MVLMKMKQSKRVSLSNINLVASNTGSMAIQENKVMKAGDFVVVVLNKMPRVDFFQSQTKK